VGLRYGHIRPILYYFHIQRSLQGIRIQKANKNLSLPSMLIEKTSNNDRVKVNIFPELKHQNKKASSERNEGF